MKTDLYNYKTEPYAHQIAATEFVADGRLDYFALFMEQGTGKTKTTIDIAENMYETGFIQRVLILAPNGVHKQWLQQELVTHGRLTLLQQNVMVWKSDKGHAKKLTNWLNQQGNNGMAWLSVNIDAFSRPTYLELFKRYVKEAPTMIVVDEATTIGKMSASRTKNVIYGLSDLEYTARGAIKSYTPCSVCRCILTGTPEAKGISKLWAMFEFLHHNYFGLSEYTFDAHHTIKKMVLIDEGHVLMVNNRPVKKAITDDDILTIRRRIEKGDPVPVIAVSLGISEHDVQYVADNPTMTSCVKHLEELQEKIARRAFKVRKQDCLDLPSKIHEVRLVEMSDDQRRIYKEMLKHAWTTYQNGALDAANKAAIRIRLRQIAGGFFPVKFDVDDLGGTVPVEEMHTTPIGVPPKYKALEQMIEDNQCFPCIVACAFIAEADYCYENLSKNYKCVLINGKVKGTLRDEAIKQFQTGEAQILIAISSTIARGFNFQNSHMMYIYSNTYSTEDRLQLEDRIHRIGQHEHATYVDLITEDSVDIGVKKILDGDAKFQALMMSHDAKSFLEEIGVV